MKTKLSVLVLTLVSTMGLAQGPTAGPGGPPMRDQKQIMVFKHELGAWWKNSKVAEKLNLTDTQIKDLESAFYQHRLKLVDLGAEMQKADMKLQQMLDADTVDETAVNTQVDQVLAARGKMEREFTNMNLTFRKILTLEQWKQLRSLQGEQMHDRIFMRHAPGPGGPGAGPGVGEPGPGPQSELDDFDLPTSGADCTTSEKNGMKIVQCTKKITVMSDTENKL
jgi:Spy/CpxP family protein refolding chaperone